MEKLTIEKAITLLANGAPAQALSDTYALGAPRWPDIAYIAEHAVTTDELRKFVDTLPVRHTDVVGPSARTLQDLNNDQLVARYGYRSTGLDPNTVEPLDTAYQLRNLLARRLMREGRHQAALRYFDSTDKQLIQNAKEYAEALLVSKLGKTRVARSEGHFKAGLLARKRGMELIGYEGAPDFYYAKGNYGGVTSQIYRKPGMSKEEARRLIATTPAIDRRYHYRYVAVEHARKAAALVPPRSQAYRALLCHGALWSPDEQIDDDLYKTYVRNGSYLNSPLSNVFGGRCETPNFERASLMRASATIKRIDRTRAVE